MEKRPIVAALVTLAVGAALFALQPEGDAPVATPQQPSTSAWVTMLPGCGQPRAPSGQVTACSRT